jgi:hypothetical protein
MTNDSTPPIIITGCARSGTSLVAGSIKKCGGFGGNLIGPTIHNQKGYFENGVIRDSIVKPYLSSEGVDPLGQGPIIDTKTMNIPNNWGHQILQVLKQQGLQPGPWFYKGAKACQMWPVWHKAFPNAKWVIVRRDTEDIVKSCMATGFMRRYKTREEWRGWIAIHEAKFTEMSNAGLDIKMIWPESMIYSDYSQIRDVIKWTGLEWKEKEVIEFIEPKLWKQKKKLKIEL